MAALMALLRVGDSARKLSGTEAHSPGADSSALARANNVQDHDPLDPLVLLRDPVGNVVQREKRDVAKLLASGWELVDLRRDAVDPEAVSETADDRDWVPLDAILQAAAWYLEQYEEYRACALLTATGADEEVARLILERLDADPSI